MHAMRYRPGLSHVALHDCHGGLSLRTLLTSGAMVRARCVRTRQAECSRAQWGACLHANWLPTRRWEINMLFVVGGDGGLRAAQVRGHGTLACAVADVGLHAAGRTGRRAMRPSYLKGELVQCTPRVLHLGCNHFLRV